MPIQNNQSGLEWEINWILNNRYLYDSELHYKSVIQNITKRYRINQLHDILKLIGKELNKLYGILK